MSDPSGAPFATFAAFEERQAGAFFGRDHEVSRLLELLSEKVRLVTVTGASGVGKTSFLRAGVTAALARRGMTVLTLLRYDDLERELIRAASPVGLAPPIPGQDAGEYLIRVAREAAGGLVLVLDHLESVLGHQVGAGSTEGRGADLPALLARVIAQAGPRLRVILCVDETAFARLADLRPSLAALGDPGALTLTLGGFAEPEAADVLERGAVQSGTIFESGLAGLVAADLCRERPCGGIDLQLSARAIVDLRLASIRKYRRSGGAAVLPLVWLADSCRAAGGGGARRVLLAATRNPSLRAADVASMIRGGEEAVTRCLGVLRARGLLTARVEGRLEVFTLAHPALAAPIDELAMTERARIALAERALRRRLATRERLRIPELWAVLRSARRRLDPAEQALTRHSLTALGMRAGLAVALIILVMAALFADSRRSYTLALDPADGGSGARVVVRFGRRGLSFLNFLPSTPKLGSIIADTGYVAGGLGRETVARIRAGAVTGTLESAAAVDKRTHVPAWLREVLNGLRPVPRGIVKELLGDPDGVVALKQAFSDPGSRAEILSALAMIGRGGAGEDEILAGALADGAPDIRRRGVEVAAAIDRARADGRESATLRAALGDRSPDVREAVLREAATLPPAEAAGLVTLAMRDPDPGLRSRAESASDELAARAPAAVLDALAGVLESPDPAARRAALALFEKIAARAPAGSVGPVLTRIFQNERTPDDARVAALLILRRTGPPSADLRAALEKATRPEASPRLRAAALPLYARLLSPAEAEEIARNEMKGAPAARAASAAVWGTVAAIRPEDAEKPLRTMLFDPATEVRIEAARAFGYLKRDGASLTEKALADPSVDVERAALESASVLAVQNPGVIAEMLGRAVSTVRAPVRKYVVELLSRLGETRPLVALPPLAHAIKDSDASTRVAAANGLCALANKNPAAVSPYLRVAARDDRDEVRTAVASCLGSIAAGDARGAARIAAELAEAGQPSVRIAAAHALPALGPEATALAQPTLIKLLRDEDPEVRAAAERAFAEASSTFSGARATEAERALQAALLQADPAERRVIIAAASKASLWALLGQAARDSDEAVRLEAVRAAGGARGAGLEIVRSAVDDRSQVVRNEAMRLLAGADGKDVLPTFEAMIHGSDRAAREAALAGIGALADPGEGGIRLLGEALGQRSESVRAAAATALGRLAERGPEHVDSVAAYLEQAVRDPAYDVRVAALPGLARAWSRRASARELGRRLATSDADSTRRFVALDALMAIARDSTSPDRDAARQELGRIADDGPALARLAARIGRAFLNAPPEAMHTFIERLLGG